MGDWDDVVDSAKDDDSSSSSSTSTSGSSSSSDSFDGSSGSDGSGGTFSLDEDSKVRPDESEVADKSKEIRKGAELNYGKHTESLTTYKRKQADEVKELHDDMLRLAREYGDNLPEFTLIFHAMFMNFAQNRVGITQTVIDEFGKSRSEALDITNEICAKAGEKKMMEKMTRHITRRMMS